MWTDSLKLKDLVKLDYLVEPKGEYSRSLHSTSKGRSGGSRSAWATYDDCQDARAAAPVPYDPRDDMMNSTKERDVQRRKEANAHDNHDAMDID